MKIPELKELLIKQHIPKDAYSFKGGLPNEQYCLAYNGTEWEAYYSERGRKSGLVFFDSESEACEYFYNILCEEFGCSENGT